MCTMTSSEAKCPHDDRDVATTTSQPEDLDEDSNENWTCRAKDDDIPDESDTESDPLVTRLEDFGVYEEEPAQQGERK